MAAAMLVIVRSSVAESLSSLLVLRLVQPLLAAFTKILVTLVLSSMVTTSRRSAPMQDLDHYEEKLAEHLELKIRGRIGEGSTGPDEIRILNRCGKLTNEGLIYEADPRHVDMIVDAFNRTSKSSGFGTPGVK